LMPIEMAEQLTRTLANSLIKNAEASRPTPEPGTRRTNKSDDVDRIFSDSGRLRS
jgi:hypothetical protein